MNKFRTMKEDGFTIAELVVSMVILITFSLGVMGTYFIMVGSAATARMKSAGLSLATEQLEYLRSLPYDQLATQGGAINTTGAKLPPTKERTVGPYTFVVTTAINYADDAFDGCLIYPSAQSYLCRNGPIKTGTPVDANPRDYKIIDVFVKEKNSNKEASRVSTQIAARVAETGGGTGAIVVSVVDSTGQVIGDAQVTVVNTTVTPNINQTINTDVNGVALFLDVTPDSGKDYIVSVSKSGYSSLSTIPVSGSLLPTYPNISVISQQVTSSTMKIDRTATDSLLIRIVDTSGNPISGSSFSIRGGVKLYTSVADQSYGYTQTGVTTNISGEYLFNNLTPGQYQVCYTSSLCSPGRYLVSAQAMYGSQSWQPFTVDAGVINQNGTLPMQTVVLTTTSSSSFPRVSSTSPSSISSASGTLGEVEVIINGSNLIGAVVFMRQSAVQVPGTLIGTDSASSIRRSFDLTGKTGAWELVVTTGSGTVMQDGLLPGTLGGFNVTP